MLNQHTPGPWQASNIGLGANGKGPYTFPLGTDPDIAAANARLIAQAPAMLGMTEWLVRAFDAGMLTIKSEGSNGFIAQARAILRAVEGDNG